MIICGKIIQNQSKKHARSRGISSSPSKYHKTKNAKWILRVNGDKVEYVRCPPLKNIRLIGRNRPKPIFNALSRLRWNCEIFISLNADFADYSVVFCHWAIQSTKMGWQPGQHIRGVHRQSCSHADENKRQRSVRTEKLQNNGGGSTPLVLPPPLNNLAKYNYIFKFLKF